MKWHFSRKWVTSCKGPQFLRCVPASSLVALFFSWQWFWMKGAVCLGASGPAAWVRRAGSLPQTSSMCLIDFQGNLGSFHCHRWIAVTKIFAMSSSVQCYIFMVGFSAQFITHRGNILPDAYRDSLHSYTFTTVNWCEYLNEFPALCLHLLSFTWHLLLCFNCTVCNSCTRGFSLKTKQKTWAV